MKKLLCILLTLVMLAGCAAPGAESASNGEVLIRLSDGGVEFPEGSGVHIANDIVSDDANAAEAARHTVVHITKPGTYRISGKLSAGQIAVDLGENAKTDPNAVVTLVLDNTEITCSVAPAVIFYNVYESGQPGGPAGAHVRIAEASWNQLTGSHTEEYDGALYSRMSLAISGSGFLDIEADNEGLCSEMHLTVDSGTIAIDSGNDGINANADGLSVITINGGALLVHVTGGTGEGDGIDSNGSIVINDGTVQSYACAASADSGIDADLGIQINGGTVIATGNMLDRIAEGGQTYAAFQFAQPQAAGVYTLKNAAGDMVLEAAVLNEFQHLLLSAPTLAEGTYTLWSGDTQFMGAPALGGFVGGFQPIERPDWPGRDDGDVEIPPQPTVEYELQGAERPAGPADMPLGQPPEGSAPSNMPAGPLPEGGTEMPMPEMPGGVRPPQDGYQGVLIPSTALTTDFAITLGANYFNSVQPVK